MPLSKRTIYSSSAYGQGELLENTTPTKLFSDLHISNSLGALQQIGYLSSYCFEVFDGALIRM